MLHIVKLSIIFDEFTLNSCWIHVDFYLNSPGEKWVCYIGSAWAEVNPGFDLNSLRNHSHNVDEIFLSMRRTGGQLMMKWCVTHSEIINNLWWIYVEFMLNSFWFLSELTRGEVGMLHRKCLSWGQPWFWSELYQKSLQQCWWTMNYSFQRGELEVN